MPDDQTDGLYGLPLDRFVPERDALAKTLRAQGNRADAEEVRRLPKPTRAAWAVNIAVREHPEAGRALVEAARLLAEAQTEVLAGGHPSALREASERARAAIEALVAAAPASGAAVADKIRSTLRAALVDADVLREVEAGRLLRDRQASGFGGLTSTAVGGRSPQRASRKHPRSDTKRDGRPRPSDRPRTRKGSAQPTARTGKQAKAEATRTARAETRRREMLRRAKEREALAENDVTAARRALEQVESALADRRAQLRQAEERFKEARRRRERAEN